MEHIKRVFFDSGKVLVYPESGEWFYPLVYQQYCREHHLPEKTFRQMLNFSQAYSYLNSVKWVKNEAEEAQLFRTFYQKLFKGLKEKNTEELVQLCVDAKISGELKFYEDVRGTVAQLMARYRLGIISDAWPSLLSFYRREEMADYFDPFIISSIYGCTKEGSDLFKIAFEMIDEQPQECLFVDDSFGNCMRARELGMNVLQLCRNHPVKRDAKIHQISSLTELFDIL